MSLFKSIGAAGRAARAARYAEEEENAELNAIYAEKVALDRVKHEYAAQRVFKALPRFVYEKKKRQYQMLKDAGMKGISLPEFILSRDPLERTYGKYTYTHSDARVQRPPALEWPYHTLSIPRPYRGPLYDGAPTGGLPSALGDYYKKPYKATRRYYVKKPAAPG